MKWVGAMAEMTSLTKEKGKRPEEIEGKRKGNERIPAVYPFPFYLFLQRRGAGNNLDDFAGDGSLTDAIHVQSE